MTKWFSFWLAFLALHAQPPTLVQRTAVVYLRPASSGNVPLRIETSGLSRERTKTLFSQLPQALNCRWAGGQRGPQTIEGICLGDQALRLTPLATLLHELGAATVRFEVATDTQGISRVLAGWRADKPGSFVFVSDRIGAPVPDLPHPGAAPIPWSGLGAPLAAVLIIPALLACAVRIRAQHTSSPVNWMAYSTWINLCIWLYWITAISPRWVAELVIRSGIDGYLLTLAVASLVYLLPPMTAIALEVSILAPLTGVSKGNRAGALKRRMLGEAVVMVPLGVFLVGIGINSAGLGFALSALVAAYVVFRALVWFHWSRNYSTVRPLESGELFERATRLAKKAGITLTRLSLMRTAQKDEANAFATSGEAIVLTEGLVNTLPLREIDSVIAHELGHHQCGHLKFDISRVLFWAYMICAEPAFGWTIARFHAPHWLLTLPIAPLLFMILQGRISQRREFEADSRGVEITGDPEGAIAALSRMARLSHVPANTGNISGAILSHPSLEGRGLAIARRFHVDEARARAILRNPQEAYRGRADLPVPVAPDAGPAATLFPLRARVLLSEQIRWLRLLSPLAGGALVASVMAAVSHLFPGRNVAIDLLAGSMLILALTLLIESLWSHFMALKLRRALAERMQPTGNAIFVGLHPGRGVRFTEGFPNWDFGFVTLEGDWLCYRGEKTRFAVGRHEILGIEVTSGPITWLRERRVELTCQRGAFTLSVDVAHSNKVKTTNIAIWLQDWVRIRSSGRPEGHSPEPPPAMPGLPGTETSRIREALRTCDTGVKIFVGASLAAMVAWQWIPPSIILLATLAGIARVVPRAIWPVRRPGALS